METTVLKRLEKYREESNCDRFVLPGEKEVDWLIGVVDQSVDFFRDD